MSPRLYCIFTLLMNVSVFTVARAQADMPADKDAAKETVNLYRNLKKLTAKGFLFGHQDDLAYGVGWQYKKRRSDVKLVTGDYPAVYGWDLGHIELPGNDYNIDSVPFKKMRKFIQQGYKRGGVITISWHAKSPLGAAAGAWDTTHGTVASILPGGINHELYKVWLDKVADFLSSLKGKYGVKIPILFRPFHELTGNWFWWGRTACTEAEFKSLWRFVVSYLRDIKQLHNLLYVYNVADFNTGEDFLSRYPGDDVVDMISFDSYQYTDPEKDDSFLKITDRRLALVDSIATAKNKLAAFGETGYEAIPYPNWWTDVLLKAIANHKISYVLLWRNKGYHEGMKKMHYYVPYKGQISADDFKKFYNLPQTLFGKDAEAEKLYGNE
jgi:mannan endo-1,4-beta-mannosidase